MLVATPAAEFGGSFSPDGRFFAFSSNETGQFELYVMEVATGKRFQVSTSTRGGGAPRWAHDGSAIFYSSPNSSVLLMADVTMEPFSASGPVGITNIRRRFLANFDLTADGQRLLVATNVDVGPDVQTATPRIRVILNWFEELKARVPTGGRARVDPMAQRCRPTVVVAVGSGGYIRFDIESRDLASRSATSRSRRSTIADTRETSGMGSEIAWVRGSLKRGTCLGDVSSNSHDTIVCAQGTWRQPSARVGYARA